MQKIVDAVNRFLNRVIARDNRIDTGLYTDASKVLETDEPDNSSTDGTAYEGLAGTSLQAESQWPSACPGNGDGSDRAYFVGNWEFYLGVKEAFRTARLQYTARYYRTARDRLERATDAAPDAGQIPKKPEDLSERLSI